VLITVLSLVYVICAQLELLFLSMQVLKVGCRFPVGGLILAARLIMAHLDFCISWGQTVIFAVLKE